MAVADLTIWIVIVSVFNYFMVYKKNELWGNVAFMGIGLTMFALGSNTTEIAIGSIFFIGSLLSTIMDLSRVLR